MVPGAKERILWILLVLVVLLAGLGVVAWWKLFREVPQQLAERLDGGAVQVRLDRR